jgi:protein involved in polysaccharide export with SLBB domain
VLEFCAETSRRPEAPGSGVESRPKLARSARDALWSSGVSIARLLTAALAAAAIASGSGAAPIPVSDSPASIADYQLGPGDKLRLITFGEDTLSGEFFVSDSGEVSLPLVGDLKAAGLSVDAFQEKVRTALADYLKDPRVSVEVENYRPVYILGEVNRPGQYPFTAGMTLLNAVATASGFTYRADTHKAYVKGDHEPKEHTEKVTAALRVQPGDTIRIGERFF